MIATLFVAPACAKRPDDAGFAATCSGLGALGCFAVDWLLLTHTQGQRYHEHDVEKHGNS